MRIPVYWPVICIPSFDHVRKILEFTNYMKLVWCIPVENTPRAIIWLTDAVIWHGLTVKLVRETLLGLYEIVWNPLVYVVYAFLQFMLVIQVWRIKARNNDFLHVVTSIGEHIWNRNGIILEAVMLLNYILVHQIRINKQLKWAHERLAKTQAVELGNKKCFINFGNSKLCLSYLHSTAGYFHCKKLLDFDNQHLRRQLNCPLCWILAHNTGCLDWLLERVTTCHCAEPWHLRSN